MRTPKELIEELRNGMIVSCQAYPGEPLRQPAFTAAMAQAVVAGGARAVRVQGAIDIAATRQAVQVPVMGLIKHGSSGVMITPSAAHARACAQAGADIVAVDGTLRARGGGEAFAHAVRALRSEFPQVAIMADCASVTDALAAQDAGADLIGTTLAGYTAGYVYERAATVGPDLDFLAELVAVLELPVVVEGRIRHVGQVAEAFRLGAHAVCVGTAITHPTTITRWFAEAAPTCEEADG